MDSRKEKGATAGTVSLTTRTEAPALNILAAELASEVGVNISLFQFNERAWGRVHFL
ncbi:hypothetical protein [Aneurinibacillus migulanus]|uniref:hypothetical protein n=1 Tax=Aneurinibacillus migulanus TaxID=47500 RepID=UPI000A566B04|nr:hypothetical protein [Aneurinibacillus migulanus]